MPRYFLNIRDCGSLIIDPDGDDLAGLAEARALALESIRDILARPETYGSRRIWSTRRFEITDETGAVLMTIPFPDA